MLMLANYVSAESLWAVPLSLFVKCLLTVNAAMIIRMNTRRPTIYDGTCLGALPCCSGGV